MKAGIIGLSSVGKTTIFNVLTHGQAAAGPAAGRKAEPNVGVVKVPDTRLGFVVRDELGCKLSLTPGFSPVS